jgi:hypothetical protein
MPRQIGRKHGSASMREPAREQLPDRMVETRSMQKDDSGSFGSNSFPPVAQ